MAVTGDAGIDEGRIDLADAGIVHPILFKGVGEVILYEDVTIFYKLVQDIDPGGLRKGESQRLFVPINLSTRD